MPISKMFEGGRGLKEILGMIISVKFSIMYSQIFIYHYRV